MDDEVLGCSSFLQENDPGTLIFYTTKKHAFVDSEMLQKENDDLIKFLGCRHKFLSFDQVNRLDTIAIQDLIVEFENLINEEKPHTILLPNPSYNQDHRVIYEAVLTALRPHDKNHFVKKILLYEQPESFGTLRKVDPFRASYFRSLNIEFKLKALEIYKSQMRKHRSLKNLETIARLRGMQVNMKYAESFEVIRWVD